MGRIRGAAFDDQRARILAQAAQLFAERGYTATSMNEVAAASGVSKPTLYHYVRDKHELLLCVAQAHVQRLQALVTQVQAEAPAPRERLARLIQRFVLAYADARHEHRVLTDDVRFLDEQSRERVLDGQRQVVEAFADALAQLRPELSAASLTKPLTMLLFGMMNWMFTWLKPGGPVDHATIAPVVVDLFLGGLDHVQVPAAHAARSRQKQPRKETCT